jgi:hypothetical protein
VREPGQWPSRFESSRTSGVPDHLFSAQRPLENSEGIPDFLRGLVLKFGMVTRFSSIPPSEARRRKGKRISSGDPSLHHRDVGQLRALAPRSSSVCISAEPNGSCAPVMPELRACFHILRGDPTSSLLARSFLIPFGPTSDRLGGPLLESRAARPAK